MPALLSDTTTNIYRLRAERRMSQQEFANLFGLSKGFICKIENGQARPSGDLLDRMAEYFRVEPSWILKRLDRRARL